MSSNDVFEVQARESLGTRGARRLRGAGQIPLVLYGHGKETLSLSVSSDQVDAVIRHGGRVVSLQGAADGDALIREVQWDTFGNDILHVDLTRVDASETVEMQVPVELRGVAPGTREGGVVQHLLHDLEISCPVASIPDKVEVNVNSLGLMDVITIADLELPDGAELKLPSDTVVVQCVEAAAEEEESQVVADGAEPEVIGKKEGDEESEG